MEGNLGGWGSGLGSGSGSSGRRLPRAHVPEPRCARSGRGAGGRELERAAGGGSEQSLHTRAAEGKPLRG
ncbi:unnamed protein product [Rangifer tarandus platyrhynchus]|uniref:Uncharacterized protein n=1 Tax=Rangifer tarandus platyrhynchus TaxID=3082113 RepID=A0ABN8ZA24_RANTA|nr:unnamed protein product [Rangifer tarandus platyrhynchus]CAI9689078.1 unnamed protein product [Rangifer tarandus platyrhynchus]